MGIKIGKKKVQPNLIILGDYNECIINITDVTDYQGLDPECIRLLIEVPGKNDTVVIDINKGESLNIDACSLGLQTKDCGTDKQPLPDGLYVIRLEINGDYVEYRFYRIFRLIHSYRDLLCCLDNRKKDSGVVLADIYKTVSMLRIYMDTIKSLGETGCENRAMEMYKFVAKELSDMRCRYCGCDDSSDINSVIKTNFL